MPANQLLTYLLVYLPPTFVLFGIGFLAFIQNPRSVKNRLVSVLVFLFSLLFLEELVRHLLPISSSRLMITVFFGNIGLLSMSVIIHLYIHLTKLNERVKIPFFPYVCYIPFLLVIYSMIFNENYINNTEFIQEGIWYMPVFNNQYYITMTVSNIIIALLIGILLNGLRHTTSLAKRKLLRFLITGTIVVLIINTTLGYPNFGSALPPHPFLLLEIIFPIFLWISILRFQLLPSVVKRYQVMFDLSPVSISVVNSEWQILELNENAKKELRLYNREGSRLLDFVETKSNENQLVELKNELEKKSIVHDYPITFEISGTEVVLFYSVDASMVSIDEEVVFYIIWRNVTEELENERLIQHMAYHDGLTELHNRAYFVSTVKERMLMLSTRSNNQAAMVLLDLNRFKEVNDTYGHAIGDEVLQHTAFILRELLRENDTVARLGGDEFVVFLENFPTKEDVFSWIDRLRDEFRSHLFVKGGISIEIEPSIGLAFYPVDAASFEELFQFADMKMYENKLISKNNRVR